MKIIRVWAIRRSGHHAVINWLKCCLEKKHSVGVINALFMPFHQKTFDGYQDVIKSNPDYLIYNIEDESFNEIRENGSKKLLDKLDDYNIPHYVDYDMYVIRDPFNCLASRWAAKRVRPTVTRKLGAISKKVIKLYIEYFDKFKEKESSNEIFVNFNKWFVDENYRRWISQRFNVPFTDEGIGIVSKWGGGSSFDKYKYRKGNKGMNMDVLNRWKRLKGNKEYMSMFNVDPRFIQESLKAYPKETHEFFKKENKTQV